MGHIDLPKLHARSIREALFYLHPYRERVAVDGCNLTELNEKLHHFFYETVLHDKGDSKLEGIDYEPRPEHVTYLIMIKRDQWARTAIDNKYFSWIAEDELAGMFVWFHFLEVQINDGYLHITWQEKDEWDLREWSRIDDLNIVHPDTPEERLLGIQNLFDTSPAPVQMKINIISDLRKKWTNVGPMLRKDFRFLFKDKTVSPEAIKEVIEQAIKKRFPSFGLVCISPESKRLAIPLMFYFSDRESRKKAEEIKNLSRIYSVKKYQEKNKEKQLVTLLLDPEVKDMLYEIAEIRGISLHKLITHWARQHYSSLRKPVQ
ncbi:hypothetical protein [Serratia marcescens]|uniref:hypothetical protein n=1 Tax=Serratia marcescens TaxID=615 RepID=UPI0029D9D03C|nr:hypothetical protein [Serratia marcescens]